MMKFLEEVKMDRSVAFAGMKEAIEKWRTWGIGLVVIGVLVALAGSWFDPTVSSNILDLEADRIVNLHRLATKIMILIAGAAISVSGVICLSVSSVIRVLRASAAIRDPNETVE